MCVCVRFKITNNLDLLIGARRRNDGGGSACTIFRIVGLIDGLGNPSDVFP